MIRKKDRTSVDPSLSGNWAQVLFDNVYSDLKAHFLQFVSSQEKALTKLFSDLQPTTKKVSKLLECAVDFTPKQKELEQHQKRLIRVLAESKLQKFLRFYTESDLVVTDSIYVEFEEITEFTRRPIGHNCAQLWKDSAPG
ncbi:hypothetical protein N1851_013242 [Merluccius polli]|uniref:Uncharacterized protein n=1 Tax=Merluccius polli TaxID=89951 RepID=A0AA47MWD4_MERPO|nr:hypothetical protein N1851_013242 [Merluccius polli]